MPDELARLDATAQAALVARGEIHPTELVDAAISRIERANSDLNAVIHPLFEKAHTAARGPLPDGPFRGVPILIKDLGPLSEGDPMCAGMEFVKRRGFIAPFDSFIVHKLRRAGFVLCGKTNAPELGILPTTEPTAFGPTRNPYDRTRSTGGSSGGSAAAVASGMVPVAHANDGGGSIRIPASCCGLVGLKPTRGRVSQGPGIGDISSRLTIDHVVARSVRDSAALLDVLAGAMPGDPYAAPPPARPFAAEVGADPGVLRIGFSNQYLSVQGTVDSPHPDCIAAVQHAARLLADLGHRVDEVRMEPLLQPDYVGRFLSVWSAWVAAALDEWAEIMGAAVTPDEVESLTWTLGEMGRSVSSSIYLRAWAWLEINARQVAAFWNDHDLLLTPTVAEPPPPIGTFSAGDGLAPLFRAAAFAPFTPPWNVTGQPGISLPLHRNRDGLPIGVQLVGAYAREDLLLRVAAQLEAAQPFVHAATM